MENKQTKDRKILSAEQTLRDSNDFEFTTQAVLFPLPGSGTHTPYNQMAFKQSVNITFLLRYLSHKHLITSKVLFPVSEITLQVSI